MKYPRPKRYRSTGGNTSTDHSICFNEEIAMKTSLKLMVALVSGLVMSAAFATQHGFNMKTAELMDVDKDGKITKEEYMKHSKDMEAWAKMDTNKDGVLDTHEIQVGFNSK